MSGNHHDLVIVGGGGHGAGVAPAATRRGHGVSRNRYNPRNRPV